MHEHVLMYVTCGSREEATRIAHDLLEARLIACANVLPAHTAIYRWEGAVQEDQEIAMIMKTRSELALHVSERVKALHAYDVPCVVALPIQSGNPDFLNWIKSETD